MNYAQHAGVVIASLLYHHKGNTPIVIHYLDGGLSKENKRKIEQIVESATGVELVFHNMINEFKSIPVSRHITHAAYYRLMIDKLLPATTVKKAIYLDTDLVVLKDIECLWNIDIKNYALGAVEDTGLRHEIKYS
jgi:lipopolysaccharide biosynthesis glycosyltransferase